MKVHSRLVLLILKISNVHKKYRMLRKKQPVSILSERPVSDDGDTKVSNKQRLN